MPASVPPAPAPAPARALRRAWRPKAGVLPVALLLLAAAGFGLAAPPAAANTLTHIQRLEELINASGTETQVRDDCRPNHAGYYENDGRGVDRLVVCRNTVNMADVEVVWEVMAHEGTHVMQACSGGPVLQDAQIPRTMRELRSLAPHYAKLIHEGYHPRDRRMEAEAFWMELQAPELVIALFQHACAAPLGQEQH
jgi:hypothetical protein